MSIITQKTKLKLESYIKECKYPDNICQDKKAVLNKLVQEILLSTIEKLGMKSLVENINNSRIPIKYDTEFTYFRFYNSALIKDYSSSLYPNSEMFVDKNWETSQKKRLSICGVKAVTTLKFPTITFINEYLKTKYSDWCDIIPKSEIINITEVFIDILEYISQKENCLIKYSNTDFDFIPEINTEEELLQKYPEIYRYYQDFKEYNIENSEDIIRSNRKIKDILEEYRNYLILVDNEEKEG